ncbi:MAG TPA: AI-2E family transporter [Thermoanaerobaculia bacterium]|nr:AI-2E family transporter [Thermoanaerobaculia bacterium]
MTPESSPSPHEPPAAQGAFLTPAPARVSGYRAPVLLSLAAAIALLYYGRTFFVTIAFAIFLAFAMRPFVSLLERARVPRVIAILLLLFVLVGALALLIINVTAQVNEFYIDLPRYQARIRDVVSEVMDFVNRLRERMGNILPQDRSVREVQITESPLAATRAFVAQVGETLYLLLYAAAVPFLTFFMLKDREKFGRVIDGMLARDSRFAGDVTGAVSRTMTDYALGLSFVMAIMAGMTTVALMLLKIRYYYILGPLAGLAIMLPYVGVIFSTVPAVAVAFFQYDGRKAITVLIVYALLQFLEGNILTPLIVGGRVRLFPLTVVVAFIFWGLLWGVAGAILAVPLTSAVKVVCENVRGLEGFARLLGEPDVGVGAGSPT